MDSIPSNWDTSSKICFYWSFIPIKVRRLLHTSPLDAAGDLYFNTSSMLSNQRCVCSFLSISIGVVHDGTMTSNFFTLLLQKKCMVVVVFLDSFKKNKS